MVDGADEGSVDGADEGSVDGADEGSVDVGARVVGMLVGTDVGVIVGADVGGLLVACRWSIVKKMRTHGHIKLLHCKRYLSMLRAYTHLADLGCLRARRFGARR